MYLIPSGKIFFLSFYRIPSLTSVLQGYGMTEAGEPTSEMRGSKGPKTGSVGVPCPMIIMKVRYIFGLENNCVPSLPS